MLAWIKIARPQPLGPAGLPVEAPLYFLIFSSSVHAAFLALVALSPVCVHIDLSGSVVSLCSLLASSGSAEDRIASILSHSCILLRVSRRPGSSRLQWTPL